jgi:hypothetical protein
MLDRRATKSSTGERHNSYRKEERLVDRITEYFSGIRQNVGQESYRAWGNAEY